MMNIMVVAKELTIIMVAMEFIIMVEIVWVVIIMVVAI